MVISITLELDSLGFLGKSCKLLCFLIKSTNTRLSRRFIDSSEMVSTFGSSPHEVRGFIARGWTACQNREGTTLFIHLIEA